MHADTAGFADDAATVYVGGNGDPKELYSRSDKLARWREMKEGR